MKKDIHFTSRMMTLAGGLMTVSGILMALCSKLAIGGISVSYTHLTLPTICSV